MDESDTILLSRYREGEHESINKLFSRYIPLTYTFLLRLTNNKTVAEDATSLTFMKAWKHLSDFDETEPFKPWLFKIARNTAYDILRKRKLYVFSDFDTTEGGNTITDTLEDTAPLQNHSLNEKMLGELLGKALTTLSPEERELLHLYYEADLTFNEIGKLLEKPLDTVKSQHRRAVIKLRKVLPDMHHL